MADISQWSTKEPENVKLDDLTLSGESGLYVNKVMCAVRKKFNSVDAISTKNTAEIGSWTDTTRTDSLKAAVEDLESDVASIVTDSQTVDMETIIDTDDVLHVNYGMLNWQQTEKTGTVSFYPVPGVTMEPVVEFAFTETPPEQGDKAPDNPSTITGVTQAVVTRCGKNLADSGNLYVQPGRGITAARTSNGAVRVDGTTSGSGPGFIYLGNDINAIKLPGGMERGKTYTVSLITTYANCTVQLFFAASSSWGSSKLDISPNASGTITIDSSWAKGFIRLAIPMENTTNFDAYIQVEEGTTATSFEPYSGSDYTIPLGSTYYGGTVDLATGVMTVTHVAVEPDASTVDVSSAPAALPLDYTDTYGREITSADGTSLVVGSTGGTVVYKLATPQTVQLAPAQILSLAQSDKYTPRLNTVYTDAQSVNVGYAKSPIRSEYELTQAIIATEGGE